MYKAYAYICIDTSDKASIVYWVIPAYTSRRSAIYRQPSARGRSCETVGMCVRDTRH